MGKFGKWIGGGLGWALGGPLGAILGFTIGSMVDGGQEAVKRGTRGGYSGRTTTGGYVMSPVGFGCCRNEKPMEKF